MDDTPVHLPQVPSSSREADDQDAEDQLQELLANSDALFVSLVLLFRPL